MFNSFFTSIHVDTSYYGRHGTKPCSSWISCAVSNAVGACGSGSPRKETAVLVGGRRRSGSRVLAGMKAEAVLHASRGVDAGIIAEMVERAERTVQEWPAEWRGTRMRRVPAGHAGNRDAAEPARAREGRTQDRPGPAALPDGRPRRVPGRPGPARGREDPVRRPVPVGLLPPAAPAVLRAEPRTARTRSTSTATRRPPPPDARPGRRPESRPCWTPAGRSTPQD